MNTKTKKLHSLTFRNNVLTFLNTFHSHAAKQTFQNFLSS